jgi:hypothetical protein
MDRKAFFKKTIVLVFLFSLVVHALLLIGFGGVTLFKGRTGTLAFVTENLPTDTAVPSPPSPDEEMVQEEKIANEKEKSDLVTATAERMKANKDKIIADEKAEADQAAAEAKAKEDKRAALHQGLDAKNLKSKAGFNKQQEESNNNNKHRLFTHKKQRVFLVVEAVINHNITAYVSTYRFCWLR